PARAGYRVLPRLPGLGRRPGTFAGHRAVHDAREPRGPGRRGPGAGAGRVTPAQRTRREARKTHRSELPAPGRQPARVALPGSGEGASRPKARARATASARVCVPSLAYRWVMWVLTVLCETYSSPAISGPVRLVGR